MFTPRTKSSIKTEQSERLKKHSYMHTHKKRLNSTMSDTFYTEHNNYNYDSESNYKKQRI